MIIFWIFDKILYGISQDCKALKSIFFHSSIWKYINGARLLRGSCLKQFGQISLNMSEFWWIAKRVFDVYFDIWWFVHAKLGKVCFSESLSVGGTKRADVDRICVWKWSKDEYYFWISSTFMVILSNGLRNVMTQFLAKKLRIISKYCRRAMMVIPQYTGKSIKTKFIPFTD